MITPPISISSLTRSVSLAILSHLIVIPPKIDEQCRFYQMFVLLSVQNLQHEFLSLSFLNQRKKEGSVFLFSHFLLQSSQPNLVRLRLYPTTLQPMPPKGIHRVSHLSQPKVV